MRATRVMEADHYLLNQLRSGISMARHKCGLAHYLKAFHPLEIRADLHQSLQNPSFRKHHPSKRRASKKKNNMNALICPLLALVAIAAAKSATPSSTIKYRVSNRATVPWPPQVKDLTTQLGLHPWPRPPLLW